MNELNHTNGKGSVERSTKWREHYDEINWHRDDSPAKGFRKFSTGQRKVYRNEIPTSPDVQNS